MRKLTILFSIVCLCVMASAAVLTGVNLRGNLQVNSLVVTLPQPDLSCDDLNDSSLIAYYRCDEVSGPLLDTKSTNNLADVGAGTSETGKIGTSRNITPISGQYFATNSNAGFNAVVTCAAWVRFGGTLEEGQFPGIISKWTGTGSGQNSFTLFLDGDTNRFCFDVTSDGSTETKVLANSYGNMVGNSWTYVIGWYDASESTLNIQINDGAVDSVSYSGGIFPGTSIFSVGSIGSAFTWTGQLEEVAVWSRVLTVLERRALYGKGLACRPAGN